MAVLFVLAMIAADIFILIKGCRIMDDEEKDHKKGMIIVLSAVFMLTILIGVLLAFFAEAAVRTAFC
jgi:predicted nucleic acid-binding Zn ribbon protein